MGTAQSAMQCRIKTNNFEESQETPKHLKEKRKGRGAPVKFDGAHPARYIQRLAYHKIPLSSAPSIESKRMKRAGSAALRLRPRGRLVGPPAKGADFGHDHSEKSLRIVTLT